MSKCKTTIIQLGIVLLAALAMYIHLNWSSITKSPHVDLPKGWKMQTNGKEYRLVYPTGYIGGWRYHSKQAAIDGAWETEETWANERREEWKPVEDGR